jgi:hypothetical protein
MTKKQTSKRGDFVHDPNFVAATPTKVLTATRGITTIVTKLYGPVDDARLALEQRMVEHRAEQLNPVPKRPERVFREPSPVDRYLDEYERTGR